MADDLTLEELQETTARVSLHDARLRTIAHMLAYAICDGQFTVGELLAALPLAVIQAQTLRMRQWEREQGPSFVMPTECEQQSQPADERGTG